MKKKSSIILVVMSLFLLFPAVSFAQTSDRVAKEKMSNEIRLVQQKKSTRSSSDVVVEAFTDGKSDLEVTITGFNGTAVVQIITGRGSSQGYMDVYEMGYEVFNIGTFRAGTYTLCITVGDEVFEGTFEKVSVGR